MSKWERTKLKGKIHVKHGFPFKSEFFSDTGDLIVLTPGNFFEDGGFKRNAENDKYYGHCFPKEYLLEKGDLIVAMTEQAHGLLGSMAFVPESGRFLHNQRLGLVTATSHEVCLEFIYYLFRTSWIRKQIRLTSTGSKVKHTSPEKIYDLDVELPRRPTQEKIAKFLSTFDAKIELNRRINKELEGMAKLLYDYWFVQFDFPITATQAAAMDAPDLEGKPYRSSGGKMIYNETIKCKIPEGWSEQPISEMIAADKAGDWGKNKKEGNHDTAVYCIRGTDLNSLNGQGHTTPPKRYILKKNTFKILEPNNVIIEISGGSPNQSTGRASPLTIEAFERFDCPLICSNFCKALTLKSEFYLYFFYLTWMRLYENGVLFNWEGKTSGIKNLLFDSLTKNYRVVAPDLQTLERFHLSLVSLQEMKQTTLKQNLRLIELRDWLLPMLMNGQVTVR